MRPKYIKNNEHFNMGDFGIIRTFDTKGNHFDCVLDIEDFEALKKHHLHKSFYGYFTFYKVVSNKKHKIILHREILNLTDDKIMVDHINGNTFDNRKTNLRLVTNSQNQANKKLQSNNNSGYVGIGWDKKSNKWRAYIKINGKHIHLGMFVEIKEAIQSRKSAEEKYFGEYSYRVSRKGA